MSMNILRATKLKYGAIDSAEPKQMWHPNDDLFYRFFQIYFLMYYLPKSEYMWDYVG